jgi:hypothetical protein
MPAQVASKTADTDSARVAAEAHHEARADATRFFGINALLLHFFLYDTLSRMMARSRVFMGTRTSSMFQEAWRIDD